jgi:hypothetical protein
MSRLPRQHAPGAVLSSNPLAAGVQLDHGAPGLQATCQLSCHRRGHSVSSWRSARFHLAQRSPTTCLLSPGERPTPARGGLAPASISFDYVTNAAGSTHGDGRTARSATAVPGPAPGAAVERVGGQFAHGAQSVARDLYRLPLDAATGSAGDHRGSDDAALGFDHAVNGAGECLAATRPRCRPTASLTTSTR